MAAKFSHQTAGSPTAKHAHGGRTIRVTVKDKHTGAPIKGAQVTVHGPNAILGETTDPPLPPTTTGPVATGANGIARLDHLEGGKYYAKATHPGYCFVPEGLTHQGTTNELTLLGLPKPVVHWGFDSNLGDASGKQVVNLKHVANLNPKPTWIGRYLSDNGPRIIDASGKAVGNQIQNPKLSPAEVALYRGHLDLVLLWESNKYRALERPDSDPAGPKTVAGARDDGRNDAHGAAYQLKQCGLHAGAAIYFTVDFTRGGNYDGSNAQMLIRSYFDGIHDVIKDVNRIGAYGTNVPLLDLLDPKHPRIKYAWQMTFGVKGAEIDNRIHIYQYDIYPLTDGWGVSGAGALDLDCAVQHDFGQVKLR